MAFLGSEYWSPVDIRQVRAEIGNRSRSLRVGGARDDAQLFTVSFNAFDARGESGQVREAKWLWNRHGLLRPFAFTWPQELGTQSVGGLTLSEKADVNASSVKVAVGADAWAGNFAQVMVAPTAANQVRWEPAPATANTEAQDWVPLVEFITLRYADGNEFPLRQAGTLTLNAVGSWVFNAVERDDANNTVRLTVASSEVINEGIEIQAGGITVETTDSPNPGTGRLVTFAGHGKIYQVGSAGAIAGGILELPIEPNLVRVVASGAAINTDATGQAVFLAEPNMPTSAAIVSEGSVSLAEYWQG